MYNDILKKYIGSSLNEIRGELKRDDNVVKLLCAISGLMYYKEHIAKIDKKILKQVHYKDKEGYLRRINFQKHNHIDTIRECVNEVLEENKNKLFNLNSSSVFFFNDRSNPHIDFVLNNIHEEDKDYFLNNYYGSRFSILIYNFEDLPFIKKGTSKKYDEKRFELFNDQDIKLHKYTILTFMLNEGRNSSTLGSHVVLNTKRLKSEPKSYFINNIKLFFNTELSGNMNHKHLISKLVSETYKEEENWDYDSIKRYILDSVLNESRNSFLEKMKKVLNHELVHMKQYLNTFKMTKYNEKYLGTKKRHGLPNVPFRKKMYRDRKKGKYWKPYTIDPHNHDQPHEVRPIEFYPRLADQWDDLRKTINNYFEDQTIIFDIEKEKLHIKNDINISDFVNNSIFLEFVKNSYWLTYLKKLANRHNKKAKSYYKKSTQELYRRTIEYMLEVEKELASLYNTNKEKVLLDIKNNKSKNLFFRITKKYLEKIDSVNSIKDMQDSDRDYISSSDYEKLSLDNFEINLEKNDSTQWTTKDIKVAMESKKYDFSKISDNQYIYDFWLGTDGIMDKILQLTYYGNHIDLGYELFEYFQETVLVNYPDISNDVIDFESFI